MTQFLQNNTKSVETGLDTVLDKGWRLGARRHKIYYNFFSIGDPPKSMVVEFTTNLVDSSYLGLLLFFKKRFKKMKQTGKIL